MPGRRLAAVLGALTVRAFGAARGALRTGGVGGAVLGTVGEVGHVHHRGDGRATEQEGRGGADHGVAAAPAPGRDRAAQLFERVGGGLQVADGGVQQAPQLVLADAAAGVLTGLAGLVGLTGLAGLACRSLRPGLACLPLRTGPADRPGLLGILRLVLRVRRILRRL